MTVWTAACQAPLPMGFPRQEHWSGLLFPSPGDVPHPGIEPTSPEVQADSEPPGKLFTLTAVPIFFWRWGDGGGGKNRSIYMPLSKHLTLHVLLIL